MTSKGFRNRVREERIARGWAQGELAARAHLSRAEVSAVETGRLIPSAAAALALASALGMRVESLFRLAENEHEEAPWAWSPGREARYWLAQVGGRVLRVPVEATAAGAVPHDGLTGQALALSADPSRTLLLAGCDPAVGLLAGALARAHGFRVLALLRSSRRALGLLRAGLVHAAGVHLGDDAADNDIVVKELLGPGYRRVHVARWTEGIALLPGLAVDSVGAAVGATLRWVGREEGSGARKCLELILEGREPEPEGLRRIASDHRGVVETIRTGWAQAGVCVELAAREGGLEFLPVRQEDYDLFFAEAEEQDPRIVALLDCLRSRAHAALVAGLPGYNAARTGELA